MDTRELIKKVRRIELVTRRLVNLELAGQYHSVFKGRGMDFDEVVPYAAGDDVRFIDWNVSARSGDLFVKRFVEERELTVLIMVDASSSMNFGSAAESKQLVAAQIAALLAMLAVRNNDRVGLLVFDDEVRLYLPPKKGKKHVLRLVTSILGHESRPSKTDLAEALQYASRVSKRRAIVFMISDFLNVNVERDLRILSRRHDAVPVVIRDRLEGEVVPRERRPGLLERWFGGGLIEARDLEGRGDASFDFGSDRHRARFAEETQREAQERDRLFARLRLDTIFYDADLPSETDYVRPIVRFFRRRAHR